MAPSWTRRVARDTTVCLERGAGASVDDRASGCLGRAQSVPKRSGTIRLVVARRGTKRQFRWYTNALTSPLPSSDNAEADGSIPSSPTKDLVKAHFWSREYKHSNAEIGRAGLMRLTSWSEGIGASGRRSSTGSRAHYVPKACPKGHRGRRRMNYYRSSRRRERSVFFTCQFLSQCASPSESGREPASGLRPERRPVPACHPAYPPRWSGTRSRPAQIVGRARFTKFSMALSAPNVH